MAGLGGSLCLALAEGTTNKVVLGSPRLRGRVAEVREHLLVRRDLVHGVVIALRSQCGPRQELTLDRVTAHQLRPASGCLDRSYLWCDA
jgi:hypothetical protein